MMKMQRLTDYLTREGFRFAIIPTGIEPDIPSAPALVRDLVADDAALAPTADQERLYWLDVAAGGDPCLNINIGFEIKGPVDPAAMEAACHRLVLQEPMLRRRFVRRENKPRIASVRTFPAPLVQYADLSEIALQERRTAVLERVRRSASRPFDLSKGPLFRIDLVRIGPDRHVLYVTMHHIVSDMRSLFAVCTLLLKNHEDVRLGQHLILADLDESAGGAPIDSAATAESLSYWRETLRGVPAEPLFSDGDRIRRHRSAGVLTMPFPRDLWMQLADAGKRRRVAAMVIMLAAYRAWLAELAGRDHFTLTIPFYRDRSAGLKIGFSGAPMLLDGSIDKGWTVDELIVDTRQRLRAVSRHRDVSLADLASLCGAAGSALPTPSAMFSFSPFPLDPVCGELRIERLWPISRPLTDFDVALWLGEWGRGTERVLTLEYDRARFDRLDARAAVHRYFDLAEAIAEADQQAPAAIGTAMRADRTVAPVGLRIVASFSAEPLLDVLEFWAELLDLPLRVEIAGYGQVLQELLAPGSDLRSNRSGVNVVLLRAEDWIRARADREQLLADPAALARVLEAAADEHIAALTTAGVPLVVAFAPGSIDLDEKPQVARVTQAVEERMAEALATAGVPVLVWADVASRLAVDDPFDRIADALGHVPLSREGFAALGTALMRRIHETLRRPFKAIVVDCDNTLWSGVVGEVGPDGIAIGERHRRLQAALVAASQAGLLICLCSKNREHDVLAVLDSRDDMILRRDHLIAWRINWQPKSANIRDLAETLGLGLDSFVVVDDNPLEIAEILAALPQVTAIWAPTDGSANFADHLWVFDRTRATMEDRARGDLYRREVRRSEARCAAASYAEFLATLALRVRIATPAAGEIERLAQLTARTNQFNVDPHPHGAEQIRLEQCDPARPWFAVHVEDRFGSYGLAGAMAARTTDDALSVDTFLMSCRVLGRGVEHRMLNAIGAAAVSRGLTSVEIRFRDTERNTPARRFLDRVPADRVDRTPSGTIYRLAATAAAGLSFLAEQGEAAVAARIADRNRPASRQTKIGRIAPVPGSVFATIAGNYSTGRAVEQAVWANETPVKALTAVEGRDAPGPNNVAATVRRCAIEILGAERFDESIAWQHQGVSSLDTMRLVAELRRTLGVSVEFSDIYASASLDDLVGRIKSRQPGEAANAPARLSAAEADLRLVRSILPTPIQCVRRDDDAILVTGGTGFLGAHMVAEILKRSKRPIICLVRADPGIAAEQRLRLALMRARHIDAAAEVGRRVVAVTGDLEAERLGLAAEEFSALAERIGLVLHNAATVSFAASYEALRGANVLGTLETIRLAAAAQAPLHFVSTLAVFDAQSWLNGGIAREEELPERVVDVVHGYAQTKYVNERHLNRARARGLVCSIYRPGNICGDSRTGAWVAGDAITRLLRGSIEIGMLPDRPRAVDLTPVDYVASAIATLAVTAPDANKNFHVVNPRPVPIEAMAPWCRAHGFPVATAPVADWLTALDGLCHAEPDHPAAPMLHLCREPLGDGALTMLDLIEARPTPDQSQAEHYLREAGITCPVVDSVMFGRCLDALVTAGFLPDKGAPALLGSVA